jgi:hypothetical protein
VSAPSAELRKDAVSLKFRPADAGRNFQAQEPLKKRLERKWGLKSSRGCACREDFHDQIRRAFRGLVGQNAASFLREKRRSIGRAGLSAFTETARLTASLVRRIKNQVTDGHSK